jgi:hypothetical protein
MRAWMPDGSRYLLAWGNTGSFADLVALSNRVWRYDHGESVPAAARFEDFTCMFGIIDTGYKAKRQGGVYEFLHDQGGRWSGVKGGAFSALGKEKPITEETTTFNYKGQGQVDVPVIKFNDLILREDELQKLQSARFYSKNASLQRKNGPVSCSSARRVATCCDVKRRVLTGKNGNGYHLKQAVAKTRHDLDASELQKIPPFGSLRLPFAARATARH